MPNAEEYTERAAQVGGWPVSIATFRLEHIYHTTVNNADPGAWVVKAQGATKEEAEAKALKEAEALLEKTRRSPPPTGCTSVPGF
jgi:hypothetical protein